MPACCSRMRPGYGRCSMRAGWRLRHSWDGCPHQWCTRARRPPSASPAANANGRRPRSNSASDGTSMPTEILMPALSPTMEEGKLAKWLVKTGQEVKPGDIIAEIETDKATMEVEAVDAGKVSELLVAEGTEGVKVNTPIATLLLEGDDAAAVPARSAAPSPAPARSNPPPAPSPPPAAPAAGKPAAAAPVAAAAPAKPPQTGTAGGEARIFASPLARRLANEHGL